MRILKKLQDHGRNEEALQILADVHGGGDFNHELVQLEYHEILAAVEFERTEGAKSYSDLLRPGIFRRVALGTSLQAWSQLTGMNVMMVRIIFDLNRLRWLNLMAFFSPVLRKVSRSSVIQQQYV
jgi:hypothetical protein